MEKEKNVNTYKYNTNVYTKNLFVERNVITHTHSDDAVKCEALPCDEAHRIQLYDEGGIGEFQCNLDLNRPALSEAYR